MKKIRTSFIVLSTLVAAIALSSCNPEPPAEPKVIDFRNKDASGKAARSARADEITFSYELRDQLNPFDGEIGYSKVEYVNEEGHKIICNPNGTCIDADDDGKEVECSKGYFEKMKAAISFEDDPDGIKLVFKKPADYDNPTWIIFQYIDGNGNRSTLIDRTDWSTFFEKGDFEIVYPLVIAGQKAHFWVMLSNEDKTQPAVNFFYEVMPAHGEKVVDNLPKGYSETDYIAVEDGHIMHITKTIPPYAKNVQQIIQVIEQNGGTYAWKDGPVNKLGSYIEDAPESAYEAAETGDKTYEYTFDLSSQIKENLDWPAENGKGFAKNLFKDNTHIFATFIYKYEMTDEKFDGYYFQTPEIKSMPVENTYFKN